MALRLLGIPSLPLVYGEGPERANRIRLVETCYYIRSTSRHAGSYFIENVSPRNVEAGRLDALDGLVYFLFRHVTLGGAKSIHQIAH